MLEFYVVLMIIFGAIAYFALKSGISGKKECDDVPMNLRKGNEEYLEKQYRYYRKHTIIGALALVVCVIFFFSAIGAGSSGSQSSGASKCKYCGKKTYGSNICNSCHDWMNDAKEAVDDYKGYGY